MPATLGGSPGTPRRRRRGDDDDEHETLLRTPEPAQFTMDAAGDAPQEQHQYGALAEDAGVAALVQRFDLVFADQAEIFPEAVKLYKHETVRSALKQHLREAGLLKQRDYAAGGTLQPLVIHRPQFESVRFLAEHPAPDVAEGESKWGVKVFSVPHKALASVMVRRGYKLVSVVHLPDDDTRLPPAVAEVTQATAQGSGGDVHPPPSTLRLPTTMRRIEKGGHAQTAASQIVEQFEIKYTWPQANGTVIVYSPMRLWTKDARKNAQFSADSRQAFGVRCMIYYYIRTLEQEPATISLDFKSLRDGCTTVKHAKAQQRPAGSAQKRARGATEEEPEPGELTGEWFDIAVRKSREFVQ